MAQCTARAFVFSGRPDPTWLVEEQQTQRLEAIWNQLKPSVAPMSSRPRLGYRGVSMVCASKEEYTAFGGYVERKEGNTIEWKKDEEILFERLLFSTAPRGLLPTGIIDTLM